MNIKQSLLFSEVYRLSIFEPTEKLRIRKLDVIKNT